MCILNVVGPKFIEPYLVKKYIYGFTGFLFFFPVRKISLICEFFYVKLNEEARMTEGLNLECVIIFQF